MNSPEKEPIALIEHREKTSVLANERTYAAWLRTGLTALATGLVSEHFLTIPPLHVHILSGILLLCSCFCFFLAGWRYHHVSSRLVSTSVSGAPTPLLIILSAFLIFASLAAILGFWNLF